MFSWTSCVYVCFINVVLQWGFRRCEDICWVKTNKTNATPGLRHDSHTLFQHSKVGSIFRFWMSSPSSFISLKYFVITLNKWIVLLPIPEGTLLDGNKRHCSSQYWWPYNPCQHWYRCNNSWGTPIRLVSSSKSDINLKEWRDFSSQCFCGQVSWCVVSWCRNFLLFNELYFFFMLVFYT